MSSPKIELIALTNFPDIIAGDDIGALILSTLQNNRIELQSHDVIAVAQKIVSKAEGRRVNLETVDPSAEAQKVAEETAKDARLVELILRESSEISRLKKGVLIVRHNLGFVSANAGIDRSNVQQKEDGEWVLLLPVAPDISAENIHNTLQTTNNSPLGILITDSHGRPHRLGTVGVAIGVAGFAPLVDKRGTADRYGTPLQHTEIGLADELAAAASLLMGQAAEGLPVILIRGIKLSGDGGVGGIFRPKNQDLYR